jgi:signal transduction histidine kinase
MIQLINTTIQTVRRIATELRPGVLDNLGLLAALEWQAQDFAQRMDLPCRLMTTLEEVEMEPERSIAVFRIFQEALTNIARHAQATAVDVKLSAEAGNLTLEVHDNGRGITEDVKTAEISLGLLGMRERALAVGGNLAITGASGQGTTITVCMPLGKREEGGSRGAGERESGRTGDGEKSALS